LEAIITGDYKFEPEESWANVSDAARDFISQCLMVDPAQRPTAEQVLRHKVGVITTYFLRLFLMTSICCQWLADDIPHFVPESKTARPTNLLPLVLKSVSGKKPCKCS
jgi:calcium/calmodulin-dependent protein kinase I